MHAECWEVLVALYIMLYLKANAQAKPCCGPRRIPDASSEEHKHHSHSSEEKPTTKKPDDNRPTNAPGPRRRCCPYDFDPNNCRTVDDRVLCGYNKNHAKVKSKFQPIDMNNGCWMRNRRVECGYQTPPYEGIRRPPAWDTGNNAPPADNHHAHHPDDDDHHKAQRTNLNNEVYEQLAYLRHGQSNQQANDVNSIGYQQQGSNYGNNAGYQHGSNDVNGGYLQSAVGAYEANEVQQSGTGVTRCLEVGNRVVCRTFK